MHFVYIIQSKATGRYYTGSTDNWEKRLSEHNRGKVRSTKAYIPWKIVHIESMPDRTLARRRELQIKSYKGGDGFRSLLAGRPPIGLANNSES